MPEGQDCEDKSPFAMLRQFTRRAERSAEEHCDLCGAVIEQDHRHLLNIGNREMLCVCRACAILFDCPAATGGARRLIPTRRWRLVDFDMPDTQWESLRVPVNMAFFSYNTPAERVIALYPGPMGVTE